MQASRIILVHNHPSGDENPSEEDIEFTRIVYEVAFLLGIQLLDHLIIANEKYTSIFPRVWTQKTKI